MMEMISQDDIPSIPIDNFRDHNEQVFELNPTQEATEAF